MSAYTVYIHRNKSNNKVYIGQTCQPLNIRWRKNGTGYQGSTKFWHAIQKYGWDNFEHKIIAKNLTKEQANELEKAMIKFYNSTDNDYGYNIQSGGNDHSMTQETKDKISQTKLSQHNHISMEQRQQMQKLYKGEGNPFFGKKHTEETRKKMSQNHANVKGGNNPNAKKVLCIETGIIYASAREAAEAVERSKSAITNCCSGLSNTCANLHWKWLEE